MENLSDSQLALKAHVEALNRSVEDGAFPISTDLGQWAESGVVNIEGFKHYMAVECYINVYKSVHGVKLRHIDFNALDANEVHELIESLSTSTAGVAQ